MLEINVRLKMNFWCFNLRNFVFRTIDTESKVVEDWDTCCVTFRVWRPPTHVFCNLCLHHNQHFAPKLLLCTRVSNFRTVNANVCAFTQAWAAYSDQLGDPFPWSYPSGRLVQALAVTFCLVWSLILNILRSPKSFEWNFYRSIDKNLLGLRK